MEIHDMSELFQHLKKAMGVGDETKVQATKIPPQHMLVYRKKRAAINKIKSQMKTAVVKARALDARHDVIHAELWEWIHQVTGLPIEGHYSCEQDGTIMKIIEKGEKE